MIVLNRLDDLIIGSINAEVFNCTYSEDKYNKMKELEEASNKEGVTVVDYNKIVEQFKLLTEETLSGVIEAGNPYIYVDKATGYFHLKNNDVISSVPMPEALVNRIKESADKKIDYMPLIKCWTRWLRNPKLRRLTKENQKDFSGRFFNFIDIKFTNYDLVKKLMNEKGYSVEVANQMATTYSMKITNEGLLAAYKVSKEITQRYKLNDTGQIELYDINACEVEGVDTITGLVTYKKKELSNEERVFEPAVQGQSGDAFSCSKRSDLGHVILVGASHSITWDQINCDDNSTCVPGLHFGGLDYIRGYQSMGTETHNVFVCPSKIGAIPDDYTGAIRCVEYFVKDVFTGVNGSIYHSSTYGSKLDQDWSKERDEIIEKFGKLQEQKVQEITKELNELKSI